MILLKISFSFKLTEEKKRKSSFIICCYNTHENRGLVQNYYTILQYGGHF